MEKKARIGKEGMREEKKEEERERRQSRSGEET